MGIEIRSNDVSATFTITADSPNRLGQMIRAIGAALEELDPANTNQAADVPPAGPSAAEWYRANGRVFYDRLQDTARTALRTVVAEGPTVPFTVVNDATGLRGSRLAGSLASVGAAVRYLRAPAPPFVADHKRKVYTADPGVLESLREVIPMSPPPG